MDIRLIPFIAALSVVLPTFCFSENSARRLPGQSICAPPTIVRKATGSANDVPPPGAQPRCRNNTTLTALQCNAAEIQLIRKRVEVKSRFSRLGNQV